MPLTRLIADAFGAAILAIAVLFAATGIICVVYVLIFRCRVNAKRAYEPLRYFNLHWLPRLVLVVTSILWCLAEIFRPHLLRNEGWPLHSINLQWQRNLCRIYLVMNLGLMEPIIFLSVALLLCNSRSHGDEIGEQFEGRPKSRNKKSIYLALLFCFIVFLIQLFFNVLSPSIEFHNGYRLEKEGYGTMPAYFTRTFHDRNGEVFCAYPLFSVVVYGLFACFYIMFLIYVGTGMIKKVINKVLRRRVVWLISSVVVLLPLRILFLGFSSVASPGRPVFEALVFFGFFAEIVYAAMAVRILVYKPVADSLAVKYICRLKENVMYQQSVMGMASFSSSGMVGGMSDIDDASNVACHSILEGATTLSIGRDSDSSAKVGSISFRTMLKDESAEPSGEVNLFVESSRVLGSPGSPPLPGKPMISFQQRSL
eukprot:TRINITY_DN4986_c0_g2_i1.p1 TRINITY_DN4986_c0_g2~~TRINITY_DN4986_c0_g2_i1.p1  ORF type:complete len:426 (+),score=31.52 TRINITY_DN4986_c0_g2_i1:1084-2361(+)